MKKIASSSSGLGLSADGRAGTPPPRIPRCCSRRNRELVMELRGSLSSADAGFVRRIRRRSPHDRCRAEGADLAVPRPRDRAGCDLRSCAARRRHPPPYRVQCEQWEADAVPREEFRELPGAESASVTRSTAVSRPTMRSPCGAGAVRSVAIAGRYLIAADGARSAVRQSLGVEFEASPIRNFS